MARQKVLREGILDKVEVLECNVCNLKFGNDNFDFVLCWDGMIEAVKELIRVTKKGGMISIFLMNKYGATISNFREDPDSALALLRSEPSYVYHDKEKHIAVSVEEARELFEKEGIKVIEIYAVCGMLQFLSIPEKVRESCNWDEKFFRQVIEMLLRLSKKSSVKGLSRHLVLLTKLIYIKWLALSIITISTVIEIISSLTLGKSGRIHSSTEKTKLIKTGIYGIIRNPIVLSLFLYGFGILLLNLNLLSLLMMIFLVYGYNYQVDTEANKLEIMFGDEWNDYCKKVGKYLPKCAARYLKYCA